MAYFSVIQLSPDHNKTTRWSGGSTTQLLISPPQSEYADRDFLWRISSAVVEDEVSTFTPLPDYHRCIATLEGSITLRHDGGSPVFLEPYQVHCFDGASATVSQGCCRDFNLMLRKGRAKGSLQAVIPAPGRTTGISFDHRAQEILLYCAEGSCTLVTDHQTMVLQKDHAAVLSAIDGSPLPLSQNNLVQLIAGTEGAKLMLAQMWKAETP